MPGSAWQDQSARSYGGLSAGIVNKGDACLASGGGKYMIRSELLQALTKESPEMRSEEIERVVDVFFDEIAKRLADGGRVELRGFGAFSTRERDARKGRNPRTGETVEVPGKEMRVRLNAD